MSAGLIAFLLALGASAWIYNKMMRTTGNNTQNSLVAAGASGFLIFIVAFFIMKTIDSMLG
jgi:uncharacterized membrane protein YdjX (TVP38/TMEM64 family)